MASDENRELLTIDEHEIALKDMKAYFYQMNTAPDHTDKVYTRDVVVKLDDIMLLNDRVVEKLQQYKDAGFAISINMKYENKKEIQFSRWEEFEKYTSYEDCPVTSIVIRWEFNAIFEKYKLPQKHSLMVKVSNGMSPEEMLNIIFSGGIQDFNEFDSNFVPVVARVDFIDRIMGDELLSIVTNWVGGLGDSAINKSNFLYLCKRYKRKISKVMDYGTYFAMMGICIFSINGYLSNLPNDILANIKMSEGLTVINLLLAFFLIAIAGRKVTYGIGETIFEALKDYGNSYVFFITRGDRNRQEKMQRQEKYDKIRIAGSIALSFGINITFIILDHLLFG